MDKRQQIAMTCCYPAGDAWVGAVAIASKFVVSYDYVHPDRHHEGRSKEQWDAILEIPAAKTGRDLTPCRREGGGAYALTIVNDILVVIGELYEMPSLTLRDFDAEKPAGIESKLLKALRKCVTGIGHRTKYGRLQFATSEHCDEYFTTGSKRAELWEKKLREDGDLSPEEVLAEIRKHCEIGDKFAKFDTDIETKTAQYASDIAAQLDALGGERYRQFACVKGEGWEFYLAVTNEHPFHQALASGTADQDASNPTWMPAYIPAKDDKWYLAGVWPTLGSSYNSIFFGVREFVVDMATVHISESRANARRIEIGCLAEASVPIVKRPEPIPIELPSGPNFWTFRADEIPAVIPEDGLVCRDHDGARAFRDRQAAEKWVRGLLATWNENVAKTAAA